MNDRTQHGTGPAPQSPPPTVVICTRDRGSSIVDTIQSVLASTVTDFELLVIDQTRGDDTEVALAPFMDDPRVRYVRSTETGVARSRSLALELASGEFILNTDDDCVVDSRWIAENVRELVEHPEAGLVFGDVVAPSVAGAGYAPESVASHPYVVRSIWSWQTTDGANVGIGASMAMRRSVIADIGGFDHRLGPGTRLRNAEDTDVTMRTLLAGHEIVRSTAVRVEHYGHRSHDDFRELTRGALFGLGAMTGKLFRRHPIAATWFAVGLLWRMVVAVAIRDLVRFKRPPVLGRAIYFGKGAITGLRIPLQQTSALLFEAER